jgi:5-methylcytosine-specific restriction enzyme A
MPNIPPRQSLPWENKKRSGFQEAKRKTDPRYHSHRWRKLRAYVLAQEPLCRECRAKKIVTAATDVDHIVTARQDDSLFYDIDNLQPLCGSCHKSKSAKEKGVYHGN